MPEDWERKKNIIDQIGKQHMYRTIAELRKGSTPRYDKFDAMVTAFSLTTLMYVAHPLVFALNLTVFTKVFKDNIRGTLDDGRIGWETIYYLTGAGLSTYYFHFLQNRLIDLCQGGTFGQIIATLIAGC